MEEVTMAMKKNKTTEMKRVKKNRNQKEKGKRAKKIRKKKVAYLVLMKISRK
jgi:hypothetical protein